MTYDFSDLVPKGHIDLLATLTKRLKVAQCTDTPNFIFAIKQGGIG